jgi:hypothetical protein
MLMEFDRKKSLQQLEGHVLLRPKFDSHLATECHRLHEVPLCDFSIENLRIMIGQNISLEYLVPIALERLHENPFAAGDFFECDLLASVLRAEPTFWSSNPGLRERLVEITERAISLFPTMPDIATEVVTGAVMGEYENFQRQK